MKAALLALGITLWAPYQCGTSPDPRPQEDSAPKALWMLAEKFEKEGNADAKSTTLHELVEQYPASRWSERARAELGMPSRRAEKYADEELEEQRQRDEDSANEEAADKAARAAKKGEKKDPESGDE